MRVNGRSTWTSVKNIFIFIEKEKVGGALFGVTCLLGGFFCSGVGDSCDSGGSRGGFGGEFFTIHRGFEAKWGRGSMQGWRELRGGSPER